MKIKAEKRVMKTNIFITNIHFHNLNGNEIRIICDF